MAGAREFAGYGEMDASRLAGHVRVPLAFEGEDGYRVCHGLLSEPALLTMQREARALAATRSAVPGARKGGSVPYSRLLASGSLCAAVYSSEEVRGVVQAASGVTKKLQRLPASRPHACSLLVYEEAGDGITWHRDTNYFRGETVTVLLTLLNRDGAGGCCSANRSCARLGGGERCADTPENSLVVLKGSRVWHSALPLREGELRVVLSMVFSTDPTSTPLQHAGMAVKDWSFFG